MEDTLGLVSQTKQISILELITSGGIGGNIIIGVLLLLSIYAVYIFFERFSAIKDTNIEDRIFINTIKDFITNKDVAAAKTLCQNTEGPISRIIEKGIDKVEKPIEEISNTLENQAKLEIYQIEKNLASLATISGAAPMIGFLGTVIGMIIAFHEMANSGGNIDVEMLSKGIYTAMVTTVGGLIVGILAYIAYNYLVNKVNQIIFNIEVVIASFLEVIDQKK
tara:strand:- start:486 stop:1151 length:666 start_codon:yes stop_codon:yes gene_type:complete